MFYKVSCFIISELHAKVEGVYLVIPHKSARVARLRPADLTHVAFTSGESPGGIS